MKHLTLFAAAVLVTANLLAGHRYRFRSVTSGPEGERTTAGTVAAEGGMARIEIETDEESLLPDNTVVIWKNGGKTSIVIDSRHKSYQELDLSPLFDPEAAARRMRISATNPKVELTDGGNGGAIEGFPTHKTTINSSYDTPKNHVAVRSEIWTAETLPAELTTFVQLRGLRTGVAEIDKQLAAHPLKGLPLRQVITRTTTTDGRAVSESTTTTISGVRESAVPASQFEVPAGYTKKSEQ